MSVECKETITDLNLEKKVREIVNHLLLILNLWNP